MENLKRKNTIPQDQETSKTDWRPTALNLIIKEDHQAGINTNSHLLSFTNLEMQEDHNASGGDKENKN